MQYLVSLNWLIVNRNAIDGDNHVDGWDWAQNSTVKLYIQSARYYSSLGAIEYDATKENSYCMTIERYQQYIYWSAR
jgi:hypothetical protein